MSTVHTRRIMGVETEFGITAIRDGQAALSPEEVARYLFRPIVAKHSSSNIFTPSAARLYLDVGSHPEYATAECDDLTQLLNHDKAGEKIFHNLALQAEQALADDKIGGQVYLFKNNVDSKGNSYGAHENYLISREMVLKSFGKQLLPFMITRQLIAGAGLIKDGRFVLSQRADQVWEGVSSATTRTRPIINTRDEPHGDSHRFRRMHVIVGDSNMAEPTFALKVGSTLLVIEMLEAGFALENFEMENPILHIREIADDATGSTQLDLVGGGTVTALEVQQSILASAKKWLEVRPDEGTSNEEMGRVIDLWERTLNAIETQDFSSVNTEIDWVIKRTLLDRYRTKLGLGPEEGYDHPKLQQIDLTYHDIHPERSLFYLLQRKGAVKRWTTDEAIAHAVDTAPETTRATLRGKFLAAAEKYNASISVDWVHLKVDRPEPKVVEMLDPFVTEDPRVDELIEYMKHNSQPQDGTES
ncbi:Pup--protein ligase [Corynebacterium sp. S7]